MVNTHDFFNIPLSKSDPAIFDSISQELNREQYQVELIASENIVSKAVLDAQGSIMTNKYAEGYIGRRYYGGCEWVDAAERLAIERACSLFKCSFANVQPHSGSQANQAVFLATLNPGDTILGMSLAAGGHLTHGAKPNLSGKWFNATTYGVHPDTHLIDYDEVRTQALTHRPRLIIAGGSAYPRLIDFAQFKAIAEEVGALLMVDMAHFAGLVAAGIIPSPLPYADIITTTTHKTLRGPRGGMVLTNNPDLAKKIDSAVFPGLQGGALMHIIAAKAVSFGEAMAPEFKTYSRAVIDNAIVLSETLIKRGLDIITGGTDTHLLLVDLRPFGVTGNKAEHRLENAGLTCNKNAIPFDPLPPSTTSGIRLGTPAGTTRGFGKKEYEDIGHWIADVLEGEDSVQESTLSKVRDLCKRFPIYS